MKKNIGIFILVVAMWVVGIKAIVYIIMNPNQNYNGLPLVVVYIFLIVYMLLMVYGTYVTFKRIKENKK